MKHILEGALEDAEFQWVKNLDVWQKHEYKGYSSNVIEVKIDHLDSLYIYCKDVDDWSLRELSALTDKIFLRRVDCAL